MQNITVLKMTANGTQDLINYLTQENSQVSAAVNYYYDSQMQTLEGLKLARWGGNLIEDEEMQLKDTEVTVEALTALAEGYSPATGKALCRNAGEKPQKKIKLDAKGNPILDKKGREIDISEGGHVMGTEITMSAPKDVSLAMVEARTAKQRQRIIEIHNMACDKTMERFYQPLIETRRNKAGKDVIGTEGCVYASFTHFTSRPVEVILPTGEKVMWIDPNLHNHSFVPSITKGADGKWSTWDNNNLFEIARTADEFYKATLYEGMQAEGYALERVEEVNSLGKKTGKVVTRIAGIEQSLIDESSHRRKQILAYQEEHGVSAQQANFATRNKKEEPGIGELFDRWEKWIDAKEGPMLRTADELKAVPQQEMVQAKSFEEIVERLHQSTSVFTRKDVEREVFMEYCGLKSVAEMEAEVSRFLSNPEILDVGAKRLAKKDKGDSLSIRYTETRYTSKSMAADEVKVLEGAQRRAKETHHAASPLNIRRAEKAFEQKRGFKPSEEQRTAIRHMLNGKGMALLEGLAGTGKTTTTEIIRDVLDREGKQLFGVAFSNKAAKKLGKECGIKCTSITKLIYDHEKGTIAFTDKDVILVDEAGMVGTRDMLKLMQIAETSGAKILAQGDAEQIQPISSGSGMQLMREVIGSSKLTEIRRQKREADRTIAYSFYEEGGKQRLEIGMRSNAETKTKGAEIFNGLLSQKCFEIYETDEQCLDAMTQDYAKSQTTADEKLMLASKKEVIQALNQGAREHLAVEGVINSTGRAVEVVSNGRVEERTFALGDRIMFKKNNKKMGVDNGTEGVIEKMSESRTDGSIQFKVRTEDGEVINFNQKYYRDIDHSYAVTVHKSQGMGKQEIYQRADVGMFDNHSALVSFTRMTSGSYKIYVTAKELSQLSQRFANERLKENVFETGLLHQQSEEAQAMSPFFKLKEKARLLREKAREDKEQGINRGNEQVQEAPSPQRRNSGPSFSR
ncbi:MobF family relaxase [Stenotrophomonas maltophilia]